MAEEPKKKVKRYYRPYNPLKKGDPEEKKRMVSHCVVLLVWACSNRNKEASISVISRETNIPRMSLHWILKDYVSRGADSTISRVARSNNYDFMIYKSWNKENKYRRRKKIIDAVKVNDPFREKDY